MKIQTLEEVERSIGGRPPRLDSKNKVRMTFYVNQSEAKQLKSRAHANDQTVSQIMRSLARHYLSEA